MPEESTLDELDAGRRLLLFQAGGKTLAAPLQDVREVVPFRQPTRLPGAPAHVAGLINLRGSVVTVSELAVRLGLPVGQAAERSIVLVESGGKVLGLAVDLVRDVIQVDDAMVEEASGDHTLSGLASGIVRLDAELVLVIDVRQLVSQLLLS